jgi:hypothetical protein
MFNAVNEKGTHGYFCIFESDAGPLAGKAMVDSNRNETTEFLISQQDLNVSKYWRN